MVLYHFLLAVKEKMKKKYLIYGLVSSLVITGPLGAEALGGRSGALEIKILSTMIAFTVYSIIGLCCHATLASKYADVGKFGLGVTCCGLVFSIVTTWAEFRIEDFLPFRFTLLVISICFAHCSLMLLVKVYNSAISATRIISISASILCACIAMSMTDSRNLNVEVLMLLGIVAIVGLISTIITSILSFTADKSNYTDDENATDV